MAAAIIFGAAAFSAAPILSAEAPPTAEKTVPSNVPVIPRAEPYRYAVAGLSGPATIRVDRYGVPHIAASTHYDAFFVQGFNAARDRLWQIDLWRRRGLGQLSEVFGADYLQQDRAARLFLYRGDLYREWLAYGSDAKRIAEAFTAGINAYVTLTEQQPDLLPAEFGLLGYRPARWAAADTVRIRSHGLWRNVVTEVRRAQIWCRRGAEATRAHKVLEPTWRTRIPPGLDPCTIPDNVLETYLLAKAPVKLPGQLATKATSALNQLRDADTLGQQLGSNNWAVAPTRTATGRGMLANDPHRGHAVPSLRYIAHLTAPGLNVIGAGEPALPGISIGHNERIGFGLTIFPIDQEDLYVYVKNKGGYFYAGKAEALRLVTETVTLPNGETQPLKLRFTRHGPVIHETEKFLFAVRAAWLEPGMAPYFGSVEYMRASNWRTFVSALNRWGAPSENQVYADVDGNIGFKPAGLFPRRTGWDGLLPVPGDGRYEWDGFFDMDVLPEEYNPERGYVSSANALNLPADYDIQRYPVGFEWSAPWRQQRLVETLKDQPQHTTADSEALQRDYRSLFAVRMLAALAEQFPETPKAPGSPDPAADSATASALALLKTWNGHLEVDSAPGALFMLWVHRHLDGALAQWLTGLDDASLMQPLDRYTLLTAARTPQTRTLLAETLATAWADALSELGADPNNWRWGDLHQIRFQHPLLAAGHRSKVATAFSLPPYPRGGSGNTTNNTISRPGSFDVAAGASFRMVLDIGNWDAATMTNAPGQSGDPRSPFYSNLLEGWATEQSFPLLYSEDAINEATQLRIELTPETTRESDAANAISH